MTTTICRQAMSIRVVLAVLLSVVASACVTTNYRPYEGASPQIGTGGTKVTIDGVDLWDDGTPPRRYLVIGMIDDKRDRGRIDSASFEADIAKKVKEVGGDAAILVRKDEAIRGYVSTGTGYATVAPAGKRANVSGGNTGVAIPAVDVITKIQVIRYAE